MIDQQALARMVEEQISNTINQQLIEVLASEDWLQPLEQKVIQYSQDKILKKFANSSTMPEIVQAVKQGVEELFTSGAIPGLDTYIDKTAVQQAVDIAVENTITNALDNLAQDPLWLERVEKLINQAVVQRTVASLGSMDINTVIKQRVDENVERFRAKLLENFVTSGISDQATQCQLTIMDDTTVFENCLTAREVDVVGSITVKDLVVKGSINTDNRSWEPLAMAVSQKTLEQLSTDWRNSLVKEVSEEIRIQGINFDAVKIGGSFLVKDGVLSEHITGSNLQSIGTLNNLKVQGEAHVYNTFSVVNKRIGINTQEPEMALSVWDEEVSVVIGKNKAKQAYIGTNRDQGIVIGVNRLPQIEISSDGITAIKQLQVGLHKLKFESQVPGYAGTRGDIVFNSNPNDNIFAWVCLGSHKWKVLRAVE